MAFETAFVSKIYLKAVFLSVGGRQDDMEKYV